MTPTAQSLRRQGRHLDKVIAAKAQALAAMRDRGATLHYAHGRGGGWWLSNGETLPEEIALALTRDAHVVGVGDALFGRELSQTFRYCDETDEPEDDAHG